MQDETKLFQISIIYNNGCHVYLLAVEDLGRFGFEVQAILVGKISETVDLMN